MELQVFSEQVMERVGTKLKADVRIAPVIKNNEVVQFHQ